LDRRSPTKDSIPQTLVRGKAMRIREYKAALDYAAALLSIERAELESALAEALFAMSAGQVGEPDHVLGEQLLPRIEGLDVVIPADIASVNEIASMFRTERAAQMAVNEYLRKRGWGRSRTTIDGKPRWVCTRPTDRRMR
jgi:hypothetical protein